MKPIKLLSVFKDYIWGGDKLKTEFNKETQLYPLAESWELSCHQNGLSRLVDSPEITLKEYISLSNENLLGTKAMKFDDFPVLLKLIDAKDNLSVQVHPNDEYAIKNENQYGKTEAWYILSAEKGAKIIYGLKYNLDGNTLKKHVDENTLLEIVNEIEVKQGDIYFIEPGIVHAIGKGIVIAEIQQNSDITYRVYDYGRIDTEGNPRQLHIDKACEVIRFNKPKVVNTVALRNNDYIHEQLIDCEYFKFSKVQVKSIYEMRVTKESFVCILCIEGEGNLVTNEVKQKITKGDSFFSPAGDYSIDIVGNCTFLFVSI